MIFVFSRCEASQSWSNCWGTLWTSPPLTTAQARWTRHWSSQGEGCRKQPRTRLSMKGDHPYWLLVYQGDREDVLRANRTQTANLVPPIRQTASIFKQPVTVVKVGFSFFKTDPIGNLITCRSMSQKLKTTSRLLQEQRSPDNYFGRKDWTVRSFDFDLHWSPYFQAWEPKVWLLTSLPWNYLGVSRDCKQLLGKRLLNVKYRILFNS